ncbi:Meckel syndrome type 1 protein homolog [Drosophila hydei]|uniref:Meckel syndrome type 1 protein homolog n=1 Tax=Drosophila hydei TaxID=7224 RepID=A0A6J1MH30_DROHY|nr:Meckel syndrome type 1 protein homolog [Drosophila hydei]
MYRSSAPKRTGIYRVKGNINDFQLELKLRHVSEWLPVPKFEYTGAKVNYGDHYPESTSTSGWSDCFIYVPYEDQYGNNYYTYYNYYNPGSDYPGSSSRATSCSSSARSGRSSFYSSNQSELIDQQQKQQLTGETGFHALNPELCNGATANVCISWQQKCFSREELQRYGELNNCQTSLQRRYHRWTRDIVELQQRYQLRVQHAEQKQRVRRRRQNKTSKTKSKSSPLSEFSVEAPTALPEDPDFATRTCLIHTLINADLRELDAGDPQLPAEAHELQQQGFQLMYIYAQLQQDMLLLCLRYDPACGLLYVYPDFSLSAEDLEYVLQIDNDCRQLYAYGFENVTVVNVLEQDHVESAAQSQRDAELELELDWDSLPGSEASAEQLVNYYQQQRSSESAQRRLLQFQLPPKRMRRVVLLLQLHEAQHFEYPNVHVRYYVNPPSHTILEPANKHDPFPLRGATATCVAGGAERLAHFSHCWQLTLLCEESHQPHQLLHIYFEVISVDSWQRERCEGYAHFSCSLLAPLPSGVSSGMRLQCIRPVGSWLDALNRYFIGGRALFDFVGYFKSRSRENMLHNRMELGRQHVMRSTGTLLFSVQKLQQRHQQFGYYLLQEHSNDDDDNYNDDAAAPGCCQLDPKPKSSVSATLQEVMSAYVEARERIEALLGTATLP